LYADEIYIVGVEKAAEHRYAWPIKVVKSPYETLDRDTPKDVHRPDPDDEGLALLKTGTIGSISQKGSQVALTGSAHAWNDQQMSEDHVDLELQNFTPGANEGTINDSQPRLGRTSLSL